MTSPTAAPVGLAGSRFEHRALLADGTAVVLRRLGPGDRAEVEALHRELPADDASLRFFTLSASSPRLGADLMVRADVVALGGVSRWSAARGGALSAGDARPGPRDRGDGGA